MKLLSRAALTRLGIFSIILGTIDKINFDRLARVVAGLESVIGDLAMFEID
ncbi:hypothetical protein [Argonema antarcticum]|uniref:hypothetical protein n=1 Tax=Argonema antarcticum TaxID=2942763 RepID=UPI002011E8DF|nr:hypothetical protein [Argonema antarcticum]MCL1473295.1 hypothetical protein [Argonema antarcticum A004/B2]